MSTFAPLAALHKDAYKIGHPFQYPDGTEFIYANFTARSGKLSNVPDSKGVFVFGDQFFVVDYLIEDWNTNFFKQPLRRVLKKYQRRVSNMLGFKISTTHIEALHKLGYLPLSIKALPEGAFVPYGVPLMTIKNTVKEFFWVVNMIESVLSAELWQPITSATTYMAFRKLASEWAKKTGTPSEFVRYQLHDFSFRGMPGRMAAAKSGAASLAMGSYATDTITAIDFLEDYYGADCEHEILGTSVSATEHAVQCAGGKDTEFDTYKRLINEVYPTGIISIVSDTWDFWNVIENYLVALKSDIMARDGKVVIRPDSGDPVEILCGQEFTVVPVDSLVHQDDIEDWIREDLVDKVYNVTPHGEIGDESVTGIYRIVDKYFEATVEIEWNRHDKKYYYMDGEVLTSLKEIELTVAQKGLVESLWDIFGGTITETGHKMIDSHIGAIYGDSITYERAEQIFSRLAAKGFASGNVVLGIGSYQYQYVTRDTHGMAMKTTYDVVNGVSSELFKDPITDSGVKKSAKGLLKVEMEDGVYKLIQQVTPEEETEGCLVEIFRDSQLVHMTTCAEIRERADKFIEENI